MELCWPTSKQEELLTLQALVVVRLSDFVHDPISATH